MLAYTLNPPPPRRRLSGAHVQEVAATGVLVLVDLEAKAEMHHASAELREKVVHMGSQ